MIWLDSASESERENEKNVIKTTWNNVFTGHRSVFRQQNECCSVVQKKNWNRNTAKAKWVMSQGQIIIHSKATVANKPHTKQILVQLQREDKKKREAKIERKWLRKITSIGCFILLSSALRRVYSWNTKPFRASSDTIVTVSTTKNSHFGIAPPFSRRKHILHTKNSNFEFSSTYTLLITIECCRRRAYQMIVRKWEIQTEILR